MMHKKSPPSEHFIHLAEITMSNNSFLLKGKLENRSNIFFKKEFIAFYIYGKIERNKNSENK